MSYINTVIPDISLSCFHNEKIITHTPSDMRGTWCIYFFYPADFTFVCPTELQEMATLYPEFQKAGCEIISVSTDTVYVHKAWHDQSPAIKSVSFPMAADPTGSFCKALGTYIEKEGLSYRASFLVDPDGVIKAYEIHDNSVGRSAAELLRKLHAAQFVRANGGEACPANWHPGQSTLTPGLNLVGKI